MPTFLITLFITYIVDDVVGRLLQRHVYGNVTILWENFTYVMLVLDQRSLLKMDDILLAL